MPDDPPRLNAGELQEAAGGMRMQETNTEPESGPLRAGAFLCSRERTISAADLQAVSALQELLDGVGRPAVPGSHDLSGGALAQQMLAVSVALALAPIDCEEVVAIRRIREVTFLRAMRADDVLRARVNVRFTGAPRAGRARAALEVLLADRNDRTLVQMHLDAVLCTQPRVTAAPSAEPCAEFDLWGEAVPA